MRAGYVMNSDEFLKACRMASQEFPTIVNESTQPENETELSQLVTSIVLSGADFSACQLLTLPAVLNLPLDKTVANTGYSQSVGDYLAKNNGTWPKNPLLDDGIWSICDDVGESLAHKVVYAARVNLVQWSVSLGKSVLMLADAVGCSVAMGLSKCNGVWNGSALWADQDVLCQEDIAGQTCAHYLASGHPGWAKSEPALQKRVLWLGADTFLGETVAERLMITSPHRFKHLMTATLEYGQPFKMQCGYEYLTQKLGDYEVARELSDAFQDAYESFDAMNVQDVTARIGWMSGLYSSISHVPRDLQNATLLSFKHTLQQGLESDLHDVEDIKQVFVSGVPIDWYQPVIDMSHKLKAKVNFDSVSSDATDSDLHVNERIY